MFRDGSSVIVVVLALIASGCARSQPPRAPAPAQTADTSAHAFASTIDWRLTIGPEEQVIDCVQLAHCKEPPTITIRSADRSIVVTLDVVDGSARVTPRGLPQPEPTYIEHVTRNDHPTSMIIDVTPATKPFPAHVEFVIEPAADCEIGAHCRAGRISYRVAGADGSSSTGSLVQQHMTIGDVVFRVVGQPITWSEPIHTTSVAGK